MKTAYCVLTGQTPPVSRSPKNLGHIIFVLWSLPFPNYSYDHFLARHNPTLNNTWYILIEIWDGPEEIAFSFFFFFSVNMVFSFSVLTKPRLSWASGSTKQLRVPRSLPLVNNFALIIWTAYFMWQAFWVSDITILFWDNLEAILFLQLLSTYVNNSVLTILNQKKKKRHRK